MKIDTITQRYFDLFEGDYSNNPTQRQTPNVLFSTVNTVSFPHPELVAFNQQLATEIGLGQYKESDNKFLVANDLPNNIRTYATAYAGHQFGNWAGQLGDGRAIFAGEIKNDKDRYTELQWKGAGATPYSRHADGRAVLRSSLREYLMSEAMHHLGIPTTRALSLSLTGEHVVRDEMYNGNPKNEKGAVVLRTAESFLRFGHFEMASAQKNLAMLNQLTDFTIQEYYPEIDASSKDKYKAFFHQICIRTADLMVDWSRVGFVHGVMNTDNMSALGLTIDYGPFSMLDEYDLNFTPNTTDLPGKRYAFGRQPQMAQWNLWQLANALFPLINDEKFLEKELDFFNNYFWKRYDEMMLSKFGLDHLEENDETFIADWQKMMMDIKIDHTLFFQHLEKWRNNENYSIDFDLISYDEVNNSSETLAVFLKNYSARLEKNHISKADSIAMMKKNNPKFILRNYLLYECIQQVEAGKKDLLDKLLVAIKNPYEEVFEEFSKKRPTIYDEIAGCSMLSCSS